MGRRDDSAGVEERSGSMEDLQSQHVPIRSKRRALMGIFYVRDVCPRAAGEFSSE